jgi:hypothetical protein
MSAAEVGNDPERERETDAEEDGGCEWEVEGGVLAAMQDVAGETTEAEGEADVEIEEGAGGGEDETENQEETAEVAERVHREECREEGGLRQRAFRSNGTEKRKFMGRGLDRADQGAELRCPSMSGGTRSDEVVTGEEIADFEGSRL